VVILSFLLTIKAKSMTIRKNSPQLWDEIWEKPFSPAEDRFALAKEANSIRWQRMERLVKAQFGTFDQLKVIEIGAGSGTVAALMAQRGAQVTLLDYSDKALVRAREFFTRNNLPADFVSQDALALSPDLLGKFDISTSFGLVEHFRNDTRQQIVAAHLAVLRSGGWTFISMPNKYSPPYRIFKFVAQRTNKWQFGEEYPTSHGELLRMAQTVQAKQASVIGSSFITSFDFINPFKALAVVRNTLHLKDDFDENRLRRERGTPIDSYASYALVLCAQKL
jgi:2-polyprenyl-3-methyl-5-hydroxy-6-metoxy-1,4-benzoquinol methylase